MPAEIIKNGSGYEVKTPNAVHAKHTTKAKAEAQKRLLNAIDNGWKPTGKKAKISKFKAHVKKYSQGGMSGY